MTEPTRRDVLKTGAAALTAGLAGCSNNENNGNNDQKQQVRVEGDGSKLLNSVIDSDALYENRAVDENQLERAMNDDSFMEGRGYRNTFEISFPQKMGQEFTQEGETAEYDFLKMQEGDILGYMEHPFGVKTLTYDVSEDELVTELESSGFQSFEGDLGSNEWTLYQGSSLEDQFSTADVVAAVNGDTAIFAPEYLEHPEGEYNDKFINDPEAAMEVALDTHSGELDSAPEGNEYNDQTMAIMQDYLQNNDLEELEDAHAYIGQFATPNDPESYDADWGAGYIQIQKRSPEGSRIGELLVTADHEEKYRQIRPRDEN